MTQKNISFWFCTLLSGIVIGIASQRIPGASLPHEAIKGNPYSFYCNDKETSFSYSSLKSADLLAYEGCNNPTWLYNHLKKREHQK